MDEQLQAQVDDITANYQQRMAQVRQRQQRAGQVTAAARSRDGLITVEVGAQGQIIDLLLDSRVYEKMSPQRLAAAIRELSRMAAGQAARQVQEIMAPVVPPGGLPENGDFATVLPGWQTWPERLSVHGR